jgi:hypothetical protein
MKDTALHLLQTIEKVLPQLQQISDEQGSVNHLPGKWSKKEILGHLIDSACNNQQKIVRGIISNCSMLPYAQDEWVAVQQYRYMNWHDLVQLWYSYNLHLANVIANIPASSLQHIITIDANTYTLQYIAADYEVHLLHHLRQLLA